ncbi:MAG: hypothetical protein EOP85_04305 [Verrucomicrobiaceae bacterium]|nr:MAG: hypothetical protein EOP85_04305 [Verrucomicrobiaceae bacterium]
MSAPITTIEAARTMFQEGFERQAQQIQSRFRNFADVKTGLTGKSHVFKKIRKMEMNDVTGRFQPTVGDEANWDYRYLFPRKAEKVTVLDEDDASELGLSVAPTGEIRMEHTSAAARKIDDIFLAGIMGMNYEGKNETIIEAPFPGTQVIAPNFNPGGSGNTGLTLAKLIKAKSRFGKLEVYGQDVDDGGDRICMAVSQDELDDLLFDSEMTGSADYNNVKALVDGKVEYFMGIHFLRTERLPYSPPSGGKIIRDCPVWLRNGVRLGFWNDVETTIKELTNPDGALQIRSKLRANSHRKDEDRVVIVQCEQDV